MKISNCKYDSPTRTIRVKYENGHILTILCGVIYDSMSPSSAMKGQFDFIARTCPKAYVKLLLSGRLRSYMTEYGLGINEEETTLLKMLEKKYSQEIAELLAMEILSGKDK